MANSYVFTLVGAYNYDRTIFDGLELPDESFIKDYDLVKNFVPMDKDTFINNLLIQCGQLSLPFTNIEYLKHCITVWGRMHKIDWQQTYETIFYAYNPIWNKDGKYTETETRNTEGGTTGKVTSNRNISDSETETKSGTTNRNESTDQTDSNRRVLDSDTDTSGAKDYTEDNITTNYVNAFDSGSDVKHDKTDFDGENHTTETGSKNTAETETNNGSENIDVEETIAKSETDNRQYGRTDTYTENQTGDKTETVTFENVKTEQGNIGVTTTQSMIQEQRDIIFNMYQYIIDQFKENFCLLLW